MDSGYMILFYDNKGKFINLYFNPKTLSENNLINGYIVYLKLDKGEVYKLCIERKSIFPSGWNQITKLIPKDSLNFGIIKDYINKLLRVKGEIKWLKPQSYIAKGAMSLVTMSTIETEFLHMGVVVSTTYIDKYKQGSKISQIGLIESALNDLRDDFNCPFFVYTFGMFKCNSSKIFNSKFIGFVNEKDNVSYLSEWDRELYEPRKYDEEDRIGPIIKGIHDLPILTNYCKSISYSKPRGYEIDSDDLLLYLGGISSRYDMKMAIDNEKLTEVPNQYFQHILMELIAGDTVDKINPKLTSNQRISIFIQVLCALQLAQETFRFEHMDLHGGNVMLVPTSDKYVTMKTRKYKYTIQLYGFTVKIIDMDFAKIVYKSNGKIKKFYTFDIASFGERSLKLNYNIDFNKFRTAYDMLFFLYALFRRNDEKQFYIISNWIKDIHKSKRGMNYIIDNVYNEYARPKLNARATPHEVLEKFDKTFIEISKLKLKK